MRPIRILLTMGLLLACGTSGARAATPQPVDVALVLAADVSRSIDSGEFDLQRKGYASAITSTQVLNAIRAGVSGAIAICFVEWSAADEQAIVGKWTVIRDGEDAAGFAETLLKAPRSFAGRTSISAGVDFAVATLAKSGVQAARRVIDVSGDGTNNDGRPVTDARDAAVSGGITINGLAIINPRVRPYLYEHTQPPGGLPNYYRENVIGGTAAFLLVVQDFGTFGTAMTNKLISEIADRDGDGRGVTALALKAR